MTLLFLTTFLKTHLQLFNQLFWCRSLCFRHRALFFVSQEGKYQDLTWLSNIPYWFKENVSWRRCQEMIFKQREPIVQDRRLSQHCGLLQSCLVQCWGEADNKPHNIKTWKNFKTSSSQLWSNSKKNSSQLWDNCQRGELDKKPLYSLQFPLRSRFVAPPILVRSLQLS